jgi:hypothetical protein
VEASGSRLDASNNSSEAERTRLAVPPGRFLFSWTRPDLPRIHSWHLKFQSQITSTCDIFVISSPSAG